MSNTTSITAPACISLVSSEYYDTEEEETLISDNEINLDVLGQPKELVVAAANPPFIPKRKGFTLTQRNVLRKTLLKTIPPIQYEHWGDIPDEIKEGAEETLLNVAKAFGPDFNYHVFYRWLKFQIKNFSAKATVRRVRQKRALAKHEQRCGVMIETQ